MLRNPLALPGFSSRRRKRALALALLAGTTLSPLVSFSRASAGTAISSAGELVTLAANQPRWQHDGANTVNGPIGLVNYVRNARGDGANPSIVGFNSLPTDWSILGATSGIVVQVVSTGTENGLPCTDIRLSGTIGSSGLWALIFAPNQTIAAVSGESWVCAVNTRVLSGSLAPFTGSASVAVRFRTSAGGALTQPISPIINGRSSVVGVAGSGTAFVVPSLEFGGAPGGVVDVTLRVSAPQLYKLASDPGANIIQPPGMIAAWTEQHEVNHHLNPRGEGGAPGLVPSNWGGTALASTGLSANVEGVGVEGGIPYVDYRVSGTTTMGQTGMSFVSFTTSGISAAAGEAWTQTIHLRLMRGSLDMLAPGSIQMRLRENNSAGGELVRSGFSIYPTTAPLASQRYSISRTFTHADTRGVGFYVSWGSLLGAEVDFVLRIGAPGLFKLGYDPGANYFPPVGQPGRSGNLRVVGLLNEEQRTNLLNNPRGEGSVSGSVPTNWVFPGSTSVIANPVVDGIPCTDMRFNHGAAVTESAGNIGGSPVSVTPGTTVSFSFYLQGLPSNNSSPLTRLLFWARLARSDGSFLASGGDVVRITQFSALPTKLTRYTLSFQVPANAATAMFRYSLDTNAAADISFRVGAPQIELGSTVTTPILPPAGSPGISTRTDDVLTVPRSVLPTDLSRGTLVAKWRTDFTPVGNHLNIFTLAEANQSRRYAGFVLAGGSTVAGRGGVAGTHNLPNTTTTIGRDGTLSRYAFTWSPESVGHALNGGAALFNSANSMFGVDPGDGLRLFGAAQSISMQPCVIESVTFQQATANAAGLQALAA